MSDELHDIAVSEEQDNREAESAEIISSENGIEITVSEDKCKCWIMLSKTSTSALPGKMDVQSELEKNKIYDELIIAENLKEIYDKFIFDRKILIAKGKQKHDGKDGEITYNFKTNIGELLKDQENEKIDFKELGIIQQVATGDVVAELVPPEEGENGIDVFGEEAEAKPGEPAKLTPGMNTGISETDPDKLVSAIDGAVSLKGNKVNVDPVVVIDGDVDYSTGNIYFKGAVFIKGGIIAGFQVKSTGDVSVLGVVEDAVVEAEGNVELKSGFVGKGTGRIVAGGEVILQFSENQNISAGGNIFVADSLLHCTVKSDGVVEVAGSKGIIGGTTAALESITALSAGNQTFTSTVLNVGMSHKTHDQIAQFKSDVKTNKANTIKVKKAIYLLNKIKLLKRVLPEKQQQLYDLLVKTSKSLEQERKVFRKTKSEIDEALEKVIKAQIEIKQKMYPGVVIEFGNKKKTLHNHSIGVTFRIKNDEISAFKKTE